MVITILTPYEIKIYRSNRKVPKRNPEHQLILDVNGWEVSTEDHTISGMKSLNIAIIF